MPDPQSPSLHPEDQLAVDALVEAGYDLNAVPAAQKARAEKVENLLGLLDHLPAEDPGDLLIERTLQAIREARQRENAQRDNAAATVEPNGFGVRWNDVLAVAAMILITLSIAMPMVSHNRANARKVACESNLAAAGFGFGKYAGDHQGQMPAVASRPGDTWWNVNTFDKDGYAESNSAHAFVLIRGGYVDAASFNCPENHHAVQVTIKMRDWPNAKAVSFSYQNQFTDQRPKWGRDADQQTIAVLADKNPLFVSGKQVETDRGEDELLSPNHMRLGGQNALISDGSVRFIRIPVLNNGDNIYHARDVKAAYTGTETPADKSDTFLVP